jgi:hypothetical protein
VTLDVEDPPFGQFQHRSHPWEGIRIERWRREIPEVDWRTIWIDLRTPGLGYLISDFHYRAETSAGEPVQTAFAHTTVQFLEQHAGSPRVDLAINTVAFHPFPAFLHTPVYLEEPVWRADDNGRNAEPESLLLGLLAGRALIGTTDEVRAARPLVALGSFLGGGSSPTKGVAVRNGQLVAEGGEPAARTIAGVSADGRILILVVADGYNPGVSIGFSPGDAAQVMLSAGALDAILLDGGGSSTLVGRGDDGRPVLLNRPAGLQKTPGTLRYVGANLGFTNLRRSNDPLPFVADWEAASHVVAWNKVVVWWRVYPFRAAWLVVGSTASVAILNWRARRRRDKYRIAE